MKFSAAHLRPQSESVVHILRLGSLGQRPRWPILGTFERWEAACCQLWLWLWLLADDGPDAWGVSFLAEVLVPPPTRTHSQPSATGCCGASRAVS